MSKPDFDYRTFYTWDHSTNWDLTQPGARLGGCHEPYDKPPGAFLEDYTRLIDFMSSLGLNHLIIWGALRDAHGGAAALRKLVQYGAANEVRVAPGVGVNCYGGTYYEGDSEFSLPNLLRTRPDLAAVGPDGKPRIDADNPRRSIACPRKVEIVAWTLASLRWLMETVQPAAIHFETGDYGVCHCPTCKATGPRGPRISDQDLACIMPPVVAEVRSFGTDCRLSYNHYTGYTRGMMDSPPDFAQAIPQDVVCKWGVSWMLSPELAGSTAEEWGDVEPLTAQVRPPTATNMAHLHFATGWWNCSPRGTVEVARFLDGVSRLKQVGFQGLCTHGEESDLNPAHELNYHVYAALAHKADATPAEIAARSVGALLGGEDLAERALTALKDGRVPRSLPPDLATAAASANGQAKVRLNWLAFETQRLAERARTRKG